MAKRKEGGVGEFIRLLIHAGIIASLSAPFPAVQHSIGSMKATLLVGDYLFVSKYSYGYGHFSPPLSPNLFSGRIGDFAKPDRGDIVVFRLPKEDSTDYIKRHRLAGDSIQMVDGILNINVQAHSARADRRFHRRGRGRPRDAGAALERDAERRELHHARSAVQSAGRQHRSPQCA